MQCRASPGGSSSLHSDQSTAVDEQLREEHAGKTSQCTAAKAVLMVGSPQLVLRAHSYSQRAADSFSGQQSCCHSAGEGIHQPHRCSTRQRCQHGPRRGVKQEDAQCCPSVFFNEWHGMGGNMSDTVSLTHLRPLLGLYIVWISVITCKLTRAVQPCRCHCRSCQRRRHDQRVQQLVVPPLPPPRPSVRSLLCCHADWTVLRRADGRHSACVTVALAWCAAKS